MSAPLVVLETLYTAVVAMNKLNVVVVKAAGAHRATNDPITACSLTVDTPRPCIGNLKRLPYKHFRGCAWELLLRNLRPAVAQANDAIEDGLLRRSILGVGRKVTEPLELHALAQRQIG